MKIYNALVLDLDASGAHYSQALSEVDLSDPEDVKVMAADSNGDVLVHLGAGNYLRRYKTYVTHVQQWRQQFDKLESVDLRYDGQIIVNPDLDGMARQPALTPAAAKAAMAAGVKTAAIVNYEKYVTRPVEPTPAKKEVKSNAKTSAKAPVRHAAAGHAPTRPAVNQPAAKSKATTATVARNAPTSEPVVHPVAPAGTTSARPAPVPFSKKKPSAAIPKETPQN
jgi:cell division protein FtsQ